MKTNSDSAPAVSDRYAIGERVMREAFTQAKLPEGFEWLNPPARLALGDGLLIETRAETDFWQGTHYGFRRDDGHALLKKMTGDFSLTTRVLFSPRTRYDQCGLMVRLDAENWIKVSTEYEDAACSRLGSVVTNLGYSDWATQDVSSAGREKWYRISKRGQDFLIEHADDGQVWVQQRIAHLHRPADEVLAGLYACSPQGAEFSCRFLHLEVAPNAWR